MEGSASMAGTRMGVWGTAALELRPHIHHPQTSSRVSASSAAQAMHTMGEAAVPTA